MKKFIFYFLLLNFTTGLFASQTKFVPPQGKTLLVVGQDKESVKGYLSSINIIPSGFMIYTSLMDCAGLTEEYDCGAGINHGQFYVDKYPDTFIQIGLYIVGMLDDIVKGVYDSKIDELGRWINSTGRPVYLRIGYEFDGPHNNYDPAKYVSAYRYIVDGLRKNNVNNVAYVWHSYASYAKRPQMDWYPGDEYVDWVGISYFDNQFCRPMKVMIDFAREHKKPVMIAEATPAKVGVKTGKQAYYKWYRPLFNLIEKENIEMLCYINTDWDAQPMFSDFNWKDSRVEKNEDIKKEWIDEINKDRYIKSSKDLFNLIDYK